MQKVIIGLVGVIIIVGAFFLFSSKKIVEVKVDEQIALLSTYGFEAKERVQDKNADAKHLVISLVDADKFVQNFPEYEQFLKGDKKDFLKEFKFGVDVTSTATAVVSADIYPISFPKETLSKEEKEIFQKLIDKKALFLKLNYNSVTKKIDGTLKDIDEKIKEVNLKVTGLNFDLIINDKKNLEFEVKNLNLSSSTKENFSVKLGDISSKLTYEGLNHNIINGFMKFDKMLFDFNNTLVNVSGTDLEFITNLKNNLIDSGVKTTIKSIDADITNKKLIFDKVIFDYGINNIDLVSFDKLSKLLNKENPDLESPEVAQTVEKLLSHGVGFYLNKFGVESIKYDKENLKGFSIESKINIAKDPNLLKNIQISPMLAMSAIDMKSKIKVSDELFSLIMKNPNAMMLMMFKPKDENGQKVYEIDLKNGALSINGQPMM